MLHGNIGIGLRGMVIRFYNHSSYQDIFWFGICYEWNGKMYFHIDIFSSLLLCFNTVLNLHPICIQLNLNQMLNLNSIQVACNVIQYFQLNES
jgi:hypothetical protein